MNEQKARTVLQSYLDKKDTSFEDDSGNIVTGWKYIIGERVTAMTWTPVEQIINGQATDETETPLDKGSFGFIVYLIPPEMTIKDICKMDDEEKDEYGMLWCVSSEGEVYMPES